MNAKTLEMLLQASLVKRYHTHTTLRDDTVGRHSGMVAWLCYYLTAGDPSVALLMAALQHDVPEAVYGDMPSPAKRLLDTEMLSRAEVSLLTSLGQENFVGSLTPHEKHVLKSADNLEGMLYTGYEVFGLGNRTLLSVYKKYSEYVGVNAEDLPAVFPIRAAIHAYMMNLEQRQRGVE